MVLEIEEKTRNELELVRGYTTRRKWSSPLDGGHGSLEQSVSVEVVGVKTLLPPGDVDLGVDALLSDLDGVRNVETHVAIDHDGESERRKRGKVSFERGEGNDEKTHPGPTESR